MNMGMNKTMTITAIAMVAVVLGISAIAPVIAVSASGIVVSINPSDRHGVIERTDDGLGNLYQFNIPRDTIDDVLVGSPVDFTIDPENSRHATNVSCPIGCVPPGGLP